MSTITTNTFYTPSGADFKVFLGTSPSDLQRIEPTAFSADTAKGMLDLIFSIDFHEGTNEKLFFENDMYMQIRWNDEYGHCLIADFDEVQYKGRGFAQSMDDMVMEEHITLRFGHCSGPDPVDPEKFNDR